MIDSKKLSHFITLAKVGNFNEAADALYITQPALSRSIQNLEERLGLLLFDRTHRAIRMTDAGKHLFEKAKMVLLELENFEMAAERIKSLDAGSLEIGTGPLPADHIGAKACAEFLKRYPNVKVRLLVDDPQNMIPKLINRELDLLLSDPRGMSGLEDFQYQALPRFPAITIARPEHPLAGRSNLTINDLKAYPCAAINKLTAHTIAQVVGVQKYAGFMDLFTYESNSVQLLLTTVKNSDAIGVILSCNVKEPLDRNEVCLLDVPEINYQVYSQYGIFTYKPRLLSLATEKYIEVVHEVAAAQVELK